MGTVPPLLSFGPDKEVTQQETSKSEMSVHTVLVEEEQVAFADWINDMFGKDTDVNHKLPLKKDGSDMYEAMDDGILLCKIINLAAPDTIDERAINKGKTVQIFKQHENLSADGKPVKEAEIIEWTNNKLSEGGKSTQIRDFKDKANRTALPIIDIVDIMKPGTINYEFVKTGSSLSDEDCFSNAKYAVNMARKIGAPVYALPEDISEVNDKMVMTVYASLMLADAEAKKE